MKRFSDYLEEVKDTDSPKEEKQEAENTDDAVVEKIRKFFKSKDDSINDDDVHAFAEKEGIDPHEFEEIIYRDYIKLLKGSISIDSWEGKGNNLSEKDVDKKQLSKGIKVEKEHTSNDELAKKIAIDHLSEFPDYYDRLEKMEK